MNIWDSFILNPLINALLILYQVLGGSFGLAIIVFTILIRLVTYPLTYSSQKSMRKMQEVQQSPEWLNLKKKYAKEPKKIQEEQMKLLQTSGANPMGGCLPTLLQFPIMIGLYQAITNAIPTSPLQLFGLSQRLYSVFPPWLFPIQKTFLWMNLAQPERLALPFWPYEIPVLAILVLITSWVSQRMIPNTSTDAQGAQTALIMNIFMVFIITNISLTLASGLSVYFVATNIFSIVQFMMMGKVNWKNVFSLNMGPKPARK